MIGKCEICGSDKNETLEFNKTEMCSGCFRDQLAEIEYEDVKRSSTIVQKKLLTVQESGREQAEEYMVAEGGGDELAGSSDCYHYSKEEIEIEGE